MGFAPALDGYAATDTATGKGREFPELADKLPWRWIDSPPHEPRMPPHQYVDGYKLTRDELPMARMLESVIDHHPESYLAYFRGYQQYNRYLEIGDGWRYWRAFFGGRSFPHRQRLDASERPRRVDECARPIPPDVWGAKYPFWPQGSGYGEWKREGGKWNFHREDPPPPHPPEPQRPRGCCAVCGRSVMLKRNGELYAHNAPHPGLPPCPGRLPRAQISR
ncbi:MAG: hypothetical protein ICV64_11195 [Thermoleophilia bacterium]|nr:hypothetical protein [Thermoleophilia bacterium]